LDCRCGCGRPSSAMAARLCSALLSCLLAAPTPARAESTRLQVWLGGNITLPCTPHRPEDGDILWRHPGNRSTSMVTAGAGALELVGLQLSDAGLYTCQQGDTAIHIVNLRVEDRPGQLGSLHISPHSQYAIVSWDGPYDGSSPVVSGYRCQHRRVERPPAPWSAPASLSPASSTCSLYSLQPNTRYEVRVAAYNPVGRADWRSSRFRTPPPAPPPPLLPAPWLAVAVAAAALGLVCLVGGAVSLIVRRRSSRPRPQPLKESPGEEEQLELVPHITLNPSFNIDMLEHLEPDLNATSEHTFLVGSPVER